MTAQNPRRRPVTSREMAAKFNVSTRTVERFMAEPREDFLARAKARRDRAVELRGQGLKYAEIAEAMEVSVGTVSRLLHDAKKLAEVQAAEQRPEAS